MFDVEVPETVTQFPVVIVRYDVDDADLYKLVVFIKVIESYPVPTRLWAQRSMFSVFISNICIAVAGTVLIARSLGKRLIHYIYPYT